MEQRTLAAPSEAPLEERQAFERQLLRHYPGLRAYARAATRNSAEADDIASETIIRALRSYRSFELGSNMHAWLVTIFHRQRSSAFRRTQPQTLADDQLDLIGTAGNQEARLELAGVLRALNQISPTHRELITRIRAGGASYEEVARLTGCKMGTLKSRLSRADTALRSALGPEYQIQGKGSAPGFDPPGKPETRLRR
jgi:RNA polymerase sigma-70 factor (ECF subfamily)